MSREDAARFEAALTRLERKGDYEGIVELFGEDASIRNASAPAPLRGRAGVYRFWRGYLGQFSEVRTRFERRLHDGDSSALAWTSDCILPNGRAVRYSGITLLDFSGGKIRNLCAYFDPSPLLERKSRSAA